MIEAQRPWIVELESIPFNSALPRHYYFAVAGETARDAQEAIREFVSATSQLVVTRAVLRPSASAALGLEPGQILLITVHRSSGEQCVPLPRRQGGSC
jgi:hypothetical protein